MLEMLETLNTCYNISTLGPDYVTWQYLKLILANNTYATDILFGQCMFTKTETSCHYTIHTRTEVIVM